MSSGTGTKKRAAEQMAGKGATREKSAEKAKQVPRADTPAGGADSSSSSSDTEPEIRPRKKAKTATKAATKKPPKKSTKKSASKPAKKAAKPPASDDDDEEDEEPEDNEEPGDNEDGDGNQNVDAVDDAGLTRMDLKRRLVAQGKYKPVFGSLGVYVVGLDSKAYSNSDAKLYTYMNWNNSVEGKAFFSEVKDIMDDLWMTEFKERFGSDKDVKSRGWTTPLNVLQYIKNPDNMVFTPKEIDDYDGYIDPKYEVGGEKYVYLHMMRFACHLIRYYRKMQKKERERGKRIKLPDTFRGTPAEEGDPEPTVVYPLKGITDINGEDFYRALVAYAVFCRKSRRKGGGKKKGPDYDPLKFKKDVDLRGGDKSYPVFYKPPNAAVVLSQSQAREQALALKGLMKDIAAVDILDDYSRGQFMTNEAADSIRDNACQKISKVDDLEEWQSVAQRDAALEMMTGDIEVMYDSRERMFTAITPGRQQWGDVTLGMQRMEDGVGAIHHLHTSRRDKAPTAEQIRLEQEEAVKTFVSLNCDVNHVSARPPSFEDAVSELGLVVNLPEDPKDDITIEYKGLGLKPWQPQASVWMAKQLSGPMRCALLADEVGLGKTVEALVTLCHMAQLQRAKRAKWDEELREHVRKGMQGQQPNLHVKDTLSAEFELLNPRPIFRVATVVGPPNSIAAWIHDCNTFFGDENHPDRHITLATFCDLGESDEHTKRHKSDIHNIPTSLEGWDEYVDSLDPNDPRTAMTLIVSTLQAFRGKVVEQGAKYKRKIRAQILRNQNRSGKKIENDEEAEEDAIETLEQESGAVDAGAAAGAAGEDGAASEYEEFEDQTLKVHNPAAVGLFIIDEAHNVKNPTLQTDAVILWEDTSYLLLTATPYKNGLVDVEGLYRFFWKALSPLVDAYGPTQNPDHEQYDRLFKVLEKSDLDVELVPEELRMEMYQALDPQCYKTALGTDNNGTVASKILPLSASLTTLRRVKGMKLDILGREVELGKDIPPWKAITVELRADTAGNSYYQAHFEAAINSPNAIVAIANLMKDGEGEVQGGRPSQMRRKLVHAVNNPHLASILNRNVDAGAKLIQRYANGTMDSYGFIHTWSKSDLGSGPQRNRVDQLRYILATSVKSRYLVRLIMKHIFEAKEKLIIWSREPLTRLLVDIILILCGVDFISIRAGMKTKQRVAAEEAFNKDPSKMAISATTLSGLESANWQHGGHIHVFMDVCSYGDYIQGLGRTHRIGQLHHQLAYIVTVDETIDQALTAAYAKRYHQQVSALMKISDEDQNKFLRAMSSVDRYRVEAKVHGAKGVGPSVTDEAKNMMLDSFADAYMRTMFGLRSRRDGKWSDLAEPNAKNTMPVEIIFRYAYGGAVAKELYAQLAEESTHKKPTTATDSQRFAPSKVAITTGPFAEAQKFRVDPGEPKSRSTIYRQLVVAARDIASSVEGRVAGVNPKDILLAAREWTTAPSEYLLEAIEKCDLIEEQLGPVAEEPPINGYSAKSKRTTKVIRNYTGAKSNAKLAPDDNGSEDEVDDEPQESPLRRAGYRRGRGNRLGGRGTHLGTFQSRPNALSEVIEEESSLEDRSRPLRRRTPPSRTSSEEHAYAEKVKKQFIESQRGVQPTPDAMDPPDGKSEKGEDEDLNTMDAEDLISSDDNEPDFDHDDARIARDDGIHADDIANLEAGEGAGSDAGEDGDHFSGYGGAYPPDMDIFETREVAGSDAGEDGDIHRTGSASPSQHQSTSRVGSVQPGEDMIDSANGTPKRIDGSGVDTSASGGDGAAAGDQDVEMTDEGATVVAATAAATAEESSTEPNISTYPGAAGDTDMPDVPAPNIPGDESATGNTTTEPTRPVPSPLTPTLKRLTSAALPQTSLPPPALAEKTTTEGEQKDDETDVCSEEEMMAFIVGLKNQNEVYAFARGLGLEEQDRTKDGAGMRKEDNQRRALRFWKTAGSKRSAMEMELVMHGKGFRF